MVSNMHEGLYKLDLPPPSKDAIVTTKIAFLVANPYESLSLPTMTGWGGRSDVYTLPETNSKSTCQVEPSQKETMFRLPTIHFQVKTCEFQRG